MNKPAMESDQNPDDRLSIEQAIERLPAMYSEASRSPKGKPFFRCLARLRAVLGIEAAGKVPKSAFDALQQIAGNAGAATRPAKGKNKSSDTQSHAKPIAHFSPNPASEQAKLPHFKRPKKPARKLAPIKAVWKKHKTKRVASEKPSQKSWIEHQRRLRRLDFGAPRNLRKPSEAPSAWSPITNGGAIETNRRRH